MLLVYAYRIEPGLVVLQQVERRVKLEDIASIHEQDLVVCDDGGEAVSDGEDGGLTEFFSDRLRDCKSHRVRIDIGAKQLR